MGPKFYCSSFSAPGRAVWMCMELMKVDYEWVEINMWKGEHKTPEYLKMNPAHTLPVLVDGDLTLVESRAMLLYLAQNYGPTTLYPSDSKSQARVNQMLFFDQGRMWDLIVKILHPPLLDNEMWDPAVNEEMKETLQLLEGHLKPSGFVAGTTDMSIADLTIMAMFSTLKSCEVIPNDGYPNVEKWYQTCKGLIKDFPRLCQQGADILGSQYKEAVKKLTKN